MMPNSGIHDTSEEKDLGVIIAENLLVTKHCATAYAYSKGNRILGMIK